MKNMWLILLIIPLQLFAADDIYHSYFKMRNRHCEERFLRRSNLALIGSPRLNASQPRDDGFAFSSVMDIYHFNSPEDQNRFFALTTELRCLVCQNQNLAESNAPLAADLRAEIYERIQQGKSNPEIIHYLVARYGNFILYRPPFTLTTLALWITPFLFLLLSLGYLFYYTQHTKK